MHQPYSLPCPSERLFGLLGRTPHAPLPAPGRRRAERSGGGARATAPAGAGRQRVCLLAKGAAGAGAGRGAAGARLAGAALQVGPGQSVPRRPAAAAAARRGGGGGGGSSSGGGRSAGPGAGAQPRCDSGGRHALQPRCARAGGRAASWGPPAPRRCMAMQCGRAAPACCPPAAAARGAASHRSALLHPHPSPPPDFLLYFEATAPLLDADPTLWCVSTWNDNGFTTGHSWDVRRLFRTSYFPGGWARAARVCRGPGQGGAWGAASEARCLAVRPRCSLHAAGRLLPVL